MVIIEKSVSGQRGSSGQGVVWLGLWFGMVNNVCHRSVGSHTRKGICKPCEGGRARHSSTSAVRSGPAPRRTIHHGVAHEVLVPLGLRDGGPGGKRGECEGGGEGTEEERRERGGV